VGDSGKRRGQASSPRIRFCCTPLWLPFSPWSVSLLLLLRLLHRLITEIAWAGGASLSSCRPRMNRSEKAQGDRCALIIPAGPHLSRCSSVTSDPFCNLPRPFRFIMNPCQLSDTVSCHFIISKSILEIPPEFLELSLDSFHTLLPAAKHKVNL